MYGTRRIGGGRNIWNKIIHTWTSPQLDLSSPNDTLTISLSAHLSTNYAHTPDHRPKKYHTWGTVELTFSSPVVVVMVITTKKECYTSRNSSFFMRSEIDCMSHVNDVTARHASCILLGQLNDPLSTRRSNSFNAGWPRVWWRSFQREARQKFSISGCNISQHFYGSYYNRISA